MTRAAEVYVPAPVATSSPSARFPSADNRGSAATRALVALALFVLHGAVATSRAEAEPPGLAPSLGTPEEWAAWDRAGIELLQRYLRVDTTNPPGNELRAAELLDAELARLGVEHELLPIAPGRANVWGVLRGDGRERPIILGNHLDVVGVEAGTWRVPPFSGALRDGEIWGRGALDMKGTAVVQLQVLRILAEKKVRLTRDVIFLGVADEEDGGTGALWFQKNRGELLGGAELFVNEGATAVVDPATRRTRHYGVATTEKSVLWLELEVTGEAGHGSTPSPDNALGILIGALDRVRRAKAPIQISPSVAAYFAGIADREAPELRAKLRNVRRHLRDARFIRALEANPAHNALIRNTVAVTSVHAGDKVNIIPGRATALLDCRLLPGTDKAAFMTWLEGQLGEPRVVLRETLYFPTLESPPESALMRAIRATAARFDPGAPVIPLPLTGTTDSSVFRAMGMITYGFEPFRLTEAELETQHGRDERVSVENLAFATRFLLAVVAQLGGHHPWP